MATISSTGEARPKKRSWQGVGAVLQKIRDVRARAMFGAMQRYCKGDVLDVGGRDFFLTAVKKSVNFDTWTTIEPAGDVMPDITDPRFRFVEGDGCDMVEFADASFDSAVCLQVRRSRAVERAMATYDALSTVCASGERNRQRSGRQDPGRPIPPIESLR